VPRTPMPIPTRANERWSMDFVRDTLGDGRAFRALTIVDDCTRESPAMEVDSSLPGARVVAVLERLAGTRGLRERSSATMDRSSPDRTSTHGPTPEAARRLHRSGKPTQTRSSRLQRHVREECLNENWFVRWRTQQTIEAWRVEYNTERSHSQLGTTPRVCVEPHLNCSSPLTPSD
jgi:putative transposase